MKMTPEQLAERLLEAMPTGLRSVVLYGSAAAGDHMAGKSDFNVLIVADRLGVAELDALSPVAVAWAKAGNRPPLLFTPGQLAGSADAFPIELLDMQQSRQVLFGEDLLVAIKVAPENLRRQLEHDLRARLLLLRERYLLTRGRPSAIGELMAASVSTFLVLGRAALRLYQDEVPARKLDAMVALAGHAGFDPGIFDAIQRIKESRGKAREVAPRFADYLAAVEAIVEAVDRRVGTTAGGR
jgi:hypothetical protein